MGTDSEQDLEKTITVENDNRVPSSAAPSENSEPAFDTRESWLQVVGAFFCFFNSWCVLVVLLRDWILG